MHFRRTLLGDVAMRSYNLVRTCASVIILLSGMVESLTRLPSCVDRPFHTAAAPMRAAWKYTVYRHRLSMRVGKGNSKGMGGMLKGNSILQHDSFRKSTQTDPNKIFLGNLDFGTTVDEIEAFVGQYGEVAHIKLVKNHYTGRSKGFAFVRFCDPISASSALSTLSGKFLNGRAVVCDDAHEQEKVKKQKTTRPGETAEGGGPDFDIGAALGLPPFLQVGLQANKEDCTDEASEPALEEPGDIDPALIEARKLLRGLSL